MTMKRWLFVLSFGVLLLSGCRSFDYTQLTYHCDQAHPCANGWICYRSLCVPQNSDLQVLDVMDIQGDIQDAGLETSQADGNTQGHDITEIKDKYTGHDLPGDVPHDTEGTLSGDALDIDISRDLPCTPSCKNKECGDDGCGGSCGKCDAHDQCQDGKCVYMSICGDGICDKVESCDTCPQDCGCPVGKVCLNHSCCTPGTKGCVDAGGPDMDGDGVPDDYEVEKCNQYAPCGLYAKYHSNVFPDGYVLAENITVKHTGPEPCCPLALKKYDSIIPCQCDWNCDGKITWCSEDDQDSDGYTMAQGDCHDDDPHAYPGAPEKCGDGVDQDCKAGDLSCKGLVDKDHDGYPAQVDCDDNDPKIHPWATETCDGKDDDCNGYIDDGNPGGGGKCHDWLGVTYPKHTCVAGTEVCVHQPGKAPEVKCVDAIGPQPEICDHLDNDCDSKTDEGFDLQTDDKNCGKCGVVCQQVHGKNVCMDGKCVVKCDSGYWDCDGNPNNGCESLLGLDQCGHCQSDKDCPMWFYCAKSSGSNSGTCKRKLDNGKACTRNGECKNGICNDEGTCCDRACDGPCRSCAGGTCKNRSKDSAPETPGACNGYKCNGSGTCRNSCNSPENCMQDFYCSDSEKCTQKMGLGKDCTNTGADGCKSGYCADGVCCESACNGKCMHCTSDGKCVKVTNAWDKDTCNANNLEKCDDKGVCKGMEGHSCTKTTQATDCLSGLCNDQDYDGTGAFCVAKAKRCVHNGQAFASGSFAPECKDGSTALQCQDGKWVAKQCGVSGCVGDCTKDGCMAHSRGCRPVTDSTGNKQGKCFDDTYDPDKKQIYCQACMANGASIFLDNKCCGDDPGEDFNNPGTGNVCCYNGVRLDSSIASGTVLCCDGQLYYCGAKPGDLSDGVGIAKNAGDIMCHKKCTSSAPNLWRWQ